MASPVVTYDDIIRIPNPRQPWALNNTALKSLRDDHEHPDDQAQGVRVLGGTYAVDGADVTFAHADEVPGATPEIETVLKAVGA